MEAHFANHARMVATKAEFVIDFALNIDDKGAAIVGNDAQPTPCVRIVVTPMFIKQFSMLMVEQLARYERDHGRISLDPRAPNDANKA